MLDTFVGIEEEVKILDLVHFSQGNQNKHVLNRILPVPVVLGSNEVLLVSAKQEEK